MAPLAIREARTAPALPLELGMETVLILTGLFSPALPPWG